jgi:hypothetical protein
MDQELKEELARLDRELKIAQASQPRKDDQVTAWEPTPLPADHFSLTPEWKRYKAGLSEPVADEHNDWRDQANGLAGCSQDEEET